MHGPTPVPTYTYSGCYADWMWTLATTINGRGYNVEILAKWLERIKTSFLFD